MCVAITYILTLNSSGIFLSDCSLLHTLAKYLKYNFVLTDDFSALFFILHISGLVSYIPHKFSFVKCLQLPFDNLKSSPPSKLPILLQHAPQLVHGKLPVMATK
jgi:hypothetical protein